MFVVKKMQSFNLKQIFGGLWGKKNLEHLNNQKFGISAWKMTQRLPINCLHIIN